MFLFQLVVDDDHLEFTTPKLSAPVPLPQLKAIPGLLPVAPPMGPKGSAIRLILNFSCAKAAKPLGPGLLATPSVLIIWFIPVSRIPVSHVYRVYRAVRRIVRRCVTPYDGRRHLSLKPPCSDTPIRENAGARAPPSAMARRVPHTGGRRFERSCSIGTRSSSKDGVIVDQGEPKGIHGTPPGDLAEEPAGAISFSPLMPGSESLRHRPMARYPAC